MHWNNTFREVAWERVGEPWDLIVVGGGITGAGILREAAQAGARALLVERRDFAWGTSSRSSKLVHGGLRYLGQLQVGVTRTSVRERERLLREAPGLVTPLEFVLAAYRGRGVSPLAYAAVLAVYDTLAGQWRHRSHSAAAITAMVPHLDRAGLLGGATYGDAQTDDARLVLRLLREAVAAGAVALNYVAAAGLLREGGRVVGVRLRDAETGREAEARAAVVINATGAWADELRAAVGAKPLLRPLRGSHLLFPATRLPVAQAISFPHPDDARPVFALHWEGATLVGTTDVDHAGDLAAEPRISPDEAAYLLGAVQARFPHLDLTREDVLSTWAGVRPVVGSGKAAPSQEARDHVVLVEDGLLTVTGGKLTTYRPLALEALAAARRLHPLLPALDRRARALDPTPRGLPGNTGLDGAAARRLLGRYGAEAGAVAAVARPGELTPVRGTATLWAELRWAARAEGVRHLDDLLLRRTRLGLLLPRGGAADLPAVGAICREELGWDDARWAAEAARYEALWAEAYSMPGARR
jgi:glycerol-3-phosphate dehydrogenase